MAKIIPVFCVSSLLLLGAPAFGQSDISGLEVGAPTQSIPVLDITGEYKGKRICYVCEFQDDPHVLAKAVAIIVAGEDAAPWLEELDESAGIDIPLTVFRRGPRDVAARLYELNLDVGNTFFVTVNRFVDANVAGIRPDEFGRVVDATAAMLAEANP